MDERTPARHPRMAREERTIAAMVHLYCRDQHAGDENLCDECRALLEYARERLARCPFQERKTTCARCPVHCYHASMRERVRDVMRYAGPRMIAAHPGLALLHLLDRFRR